MYPTECRTVQKEIKTKREISATVLQEKFKGKHIDKVLDDLARSGATERILKRENGEDMIYYKLSKKTVLFKQGRKSFLSDLR